MRKLGHSELLSRQEKQSQAKETISLSVVLNDVRSLYNVGSIFRTADGAGVEKIWLSGITGTPETERSRIGKTALGAEKKVPWEYQKDPLIPIRELKKKGYEIVLLEQIEESIPYQEYQPKGPVCLVIGNEISGVSNELLGLADQAIEIEMSGLKNSLNVTVAFGIAAYHIKGCFAKRSSLRGTSQLRPKQSLSSEIASLRSQ